MSFAHPQAWSICRALLDHGVVADYREPDILRFGLSPLILRFQDMRELARRLARVMRAQPWHVAQYQQRPRVT